MRLIDADSLIEECYKDGAYGYVDALQIATAPTIEAEPVKHGKWKLIGADKLGRGGNWECDGRDGCGKLYPYKCNYCPNCGAKMDKEGA